MGPAEVLPPAGPGLSTLTVGVAERGLCAMTALRSTLWLVRPCVRGYAAPAARPFAPADRRALRSAASRTEHDLVIRGCRGADFTPSDG